MNNKKHPSEEALKKAFDKHQMVFDEKAFTQFGQALDKIPVSVDPTWLTIIKSKIFFAAATVITSAAIISYSISEGTDFLNHPLSVSASDIPAEKSEKINQTINTTLNNKKTQVELSATSQFVDSENFDNDQSNTVNALVNEGPASDTDKLLATPSRPMDAITNTGVSSIQNDVDASAAKITMGNGTQNREELELNNNATAATSTLSQSKNSDAQLPTHPKVNENETLSNLLSERSVKRPALLIDKMAPLDLNYSFSGLEQKFDESLLLDFNETKVMSSAFPDSYKSRGYFYIMASALMTTDIHSFSGDDFFLPGKNQQFNWRVNVGYQINRDWAVELGFMKRTVMQAWTINQNFNQAGTGTGYNSFDATYLSTRVVGSISIFENKLFFTPKFGYTLGNPDTMLGENGSGSGKILNYPLNDQELQYESETFGLRENAFHAIELGMGIEWAITHNVNVNLSYGLFKSFNDIEVENFSYSINESPTREFNIKSNGTIRALEFGLKYNFQ